MISVVIATHNDARTLGETLSALVPAAVDGLVREVILADAGSVDETLQIADDAGARVVQGQGSDDVRIAQASQMARGEWLLFLDVDHAPPPGWESAVKGHLQAGMDRAASWGGGLWPFAGRSPALLISRRLYDQVSDDGPGFSRRLGGRLRRLKLPKRR